MKPQVIVIVLVMTMVSGKLKENPNFEEVKCGLLPTQDYCNNESNGWCKWDENINYCMDSYNSILFISTWDSAAMSRSLISFVMLVCCLFLWYFSGLLTKKLKWFKNIESDKLEKCQIYIFELFGLTYAISYLLIAKTFNVIFKANDYADIGPQETLNLTRSLSSLVWLMYMYCIEMLTNELRWSLKLHHIVVIIATTYFMLILDDYADLASLRCGLCLALYAFTEQNVFAQLLLYRIAPLWCWQIHLFSAIFYVLTRIFITCAFFYCWFQWVLSDEIKNQFNGTNKAHYPYLGFFFIMPISNVLLNIAQFQTIKALFYVAKSVYNRVKERNRLLKYPKLQQLYDIFIEFDSDDDGYWTLNDFKKFIYYHNQTFIQRDTCIILWNCLGFTSTVKRADHRRPKDDEKTDNDDDSGSLDALSSNRGHTETFTVDDLENVDVSKLKIKKRSNMRWKDFRKIFGEHLKSDKFADHCVKQIVSAQLQVLIVTIFNARSEFEKGPDIDDKDEAMLKLYSDVNHLIKKRRKESEGRAKEIEMYIKTDDELGDDEKELRKVVSMAMLDDQIVTKQLELDDSKRNNLQRPSSIMHIAPSSLRKEETV